MVPQGSNVTASPREASSRSKAGRRSLLLLEFLGLFVAAPSLLYFLVPLPVVLLLWVFAVACTRALMKDPEFDRANLWRGSALAVRGTAMLGRFAACGGALAALVYFCAPHLLLDLPRQRPAIWLLIVLLYPLLSVYPQELIYRTYFFHRYDTLFPRKWLLLTFSALTFGYGHIVYHNWIAVGLAAAGGATFVVTYERSRSTLLVSIEHSLFGCLLFTLGLGRFFYSGHFSH